MPTRTKQVFITPEEFVQWVPEMAQAMGASLILWDFAIRQPLHWDGTSESLLRAYRVYFAEKKPDLSGLVANDIAPGYLGWFDVDVPKIKDNKLLLISLGVKSNPDEGKNPPVIKFFDKFWRQWKKRFRYGVMTNSIRPGAPDVLLRDIAYSPGVVDWQRKGGELGQQGVANGRFYLPPEAESSA